MGLEAGEADARAPLEPRRPRRRRTTGFQRLYDVPERVLPAAVLDAPDAGGAGAPAALALRAVHARGALTERGIVEHWRLKGGTARIRATVASLVEDGELERLGVEEGRRRPRRAGTELDRPRPSVAILLSPFENLLWDRPFARRILGFDHLIEVYKPAPQRRYGYYVLPFLWRDRVAGRVDLKSERATEAGRPGVPPRGRRQAVRRSTTLSTARSTGCAGSSGWSASAGDRALVPKARQLAVAAQLLDGRAPTTVTEVVRALGSVQDPVAAVARAERMVLFSRLAYDAQSSPPRSIAARSSSTGRTSSRRRTTASIASRCRYPRGDLTRSRYIREWLAANACSAATSSARSVAVGRCCRATSMTAPVPWQTGGWNDGKSVGRMLDILWFRGEIAIAGREGNERVWDAAESGCRATSRDFTRGRPRGRRGWPAAQGRRAPTGVRAAARRRPAGRRRGLSLARPGRDRGARARHGARRRLVGAPRRARARPGGARTVLLSPFDRLVYDRERTAELFGFRYRLEMYVAPAKREFGYVLPILHGTQLIGRVDATVDMRAGVLRVDGLWAEEHRRRRERTSPGAARARVLARRGACRVGRRVPRMGEGAPCLSRAAAGTAPRDLPGAPSTRRRPGASRSGRAPRRSATDVLATVHRLGFLQLDPIATVAPAQHVVLWSRLGSFDVAELDRLCWEKRSLFEWDAFLWPIEQLPLVRGFMRRWRSSTHYKAERWVRDFLAENRGFRRYVLREPAEGPAALARARGPVGGREGGAPVVRIEERLMLASLHLRGEVAVAGRVAGQRLGDSERVLPETETLRTRTRSGATAPIASARSACGSATAGWEAHPEAVDGDVPDRVTFLSPSTG